MHDQNERAEPPAEGEYRLKTWQEFEAQLPQHVRDKINAKFKVTMARLRLGDIREAVGKTQVEVAAELRLGQGSVSKIERAADMYLSTLRRYVEALGGELEVLARFPEGTVVPIASLATPKRAVRKRVVESRTSGAKKKPAARKSAPTRSGKQASRKR
jgi:transcriptional regulator with XRE-family HTH domain